MGRPIEWRIEDIRVIPTCRLDSPRNADRLQGLSRATVDGLGEIPQLVLSWCQFSGRFELFIRIIRGRRSIGSIVSCGVIRVIRVTRYSDRND